MNKKIMILGAAANQVPLITTAKDLGYEVIVCDWTTDNPGITMANKHYQVSILDKDVCLHIAQDECIDGVISNYEAGMTTVAYITEKLGLVGNSEKGIECIRSKNGFRNLQEECGLYAPKHIVSHSYENVKSVLTEFSFPVIVKPCECSATRGTTKIESINDDIESAFNACISLSRNGNACIEEYVEMPTLEIIDGDVFVYGDNLFMDGMFTSVRYDFAPMVPTTQVFPAVVEENRLRVIRDALKNIFTKADVHFGEFNVEMYFDSMDRLFIIEINVRQGGNGIPKSIYKHTGIDFTKLLVSLAVGDESYMNQVQSVTCKKKYICRHPVYSAEEGIFESLTILPPPGAKVDGIEIIKKSGEKINRCTCALDVIGFADFEFDDIDSQRCVYNKLNDFCHIKLK